MKKRWVKTPHIFSEVDRITFLSTFSESAKSQISGCPNIGKWLTCCIDVCVKLCVLSNVADCWNNRRSRHVFLCFYSAIFQLTSAKFQTFAYNSRTVGSNNMKFGRQFEINELYVCTQFRGNRSRDFGFKTRKPPRKFGVKSGFSQKRLKYGKKIFHRVVCLKLPFHPNQSTFGRDEVYFFFFSFFSS